MNDETLDLALEGVFQKALTPGAAEMAAMQIRMAARLQQEQQDWTTFTAVMLNLNTCLQSVQYCLNRSAHLLKPVRG